MKPLTTDQKLQKDKELLKIQQEDTKPNNRYQQFFEQSADALLIIENRKNVDCNQALLDLLQYKNKHDIISKQISEISPKFQPDGERSAVKANKMIALAIKNGAHRFEWYHQKSSGDIFPTEISLTAISNNSGKEIIHAIIHDISEQKEVASSLLESEDRFKQLSNLAYEGIIIHDNGTALDVNMAIERISGYSKEEIIGNNILDLFVPEKYKSLVYNKIVKNLTTPYKIEAQHKKGYLVPIEIESRNITINNKKIRVTAIRDLSERLKVKSELEESRKEYKKSYELFRLMADTTPDMIWAKDMEGNFTFTNKAICEKLINAKDIKEPIGKHVMFFVNRERESHPDDKKWFTFGEECGDSDAITIAKKETCRFIEYGNVFGKNLILDVYKAPLWNDKGEMIGTVGSARDITKQHEAEKKLKLSEKRYRTLFENAPDPIIIHDGKSILDVNKATIKAVSLKSKNDLIGKEIYYLVHPDDRTMAKQRMEEMLRDFKPLETIEFRIVTPAGKVVTTLATPAPIYFESKPAFMVTYHDITNRKKAEQIIVNKEKLFHSVVESAGDAIYLADFNTGKFLLTNEAAAEMTGYTNKELLNLKLSDLYASLNDKKYMQGLLKQMAQNKSTTITIDHRHKDGHIFPVEIKITLIDYNGKKTVLGFARDITEWEKAKNALKESEERFKKLSDINFEGILIHEKGIAIDMNASLANMFGYKKDELIGKNLVQLLVAKEYRPIITQHIKESHAPSYRIIGIKKDGTRFPVELEAKSIKYNNNETIRVAAFRDITYRVKAERELKNAYDELAIQNEDLETLNTKLTKSIEQVKIYNAKLKVAIKRAEESDRLKSAFLANMSHEIRTPMNGILGFSGLLKNMNISIQERLTYLDVIDKSANRLLNIINNLIDISKIESGLMTLQKSDYNITKQSEEIFSFFKLEAQQKGLKFIYRKPKSNVPVVIHTDIDKFNAILSNLLKNAIKYTIKGGITMGYRKIDSYLEFFIKDTGIGIPKDRHKAIFDRFIQADIEDRQAFEGAGLGLAITKAYVEMLGGKIWVESNEDEGSTFYFTIPYKNTKKMTAIKETSTAQYNTENALPKINVLIAEDELFSDELLTILVKKFAGNIYHAETSEKTIEVFKTTPDIDLVLMDIKLPKLGGYHAVKEIRKLSEKVVIIAQTAYALVGDREKAIAAGCNDYMTKPIIKNRLLSLIGKYFSK